MYISLWKYTFLHQYPIFMPNKQEITSLWLLWEIGLQRQLSRLIYSVSCCWACVYTVTTFKLGAGHILCPRLPKITSNGSLGWLLPVDSGRPWDNSFICLFVPWVFGWPFRALFGPSPCWASISETQVALNEAGRVGMGPQQTQAWSDPSSSALAATHHLLPLAS